MNFIRKIWCKIVNEFCDTIEEFFTSGSLPRGSNITWVTLIPMVERAKEIKDFRPISMVAVYSKLYPR